MKEKKTKNVEKLRKRLTEMEPGRVQIINGKSIDKVGHDDFEILVSMKLEHAVKILAGENYFKAIT